MRTAPLYRAVLFFSIVAVGCVADLVSKHLVFAQLGRPLGQRLEIIPDVFYLETSLNQGALFGIGQGMTFLFALLSILAALAILYWLFWAGAAESRLLTVTLALITAGILGNLYDRLGLPGLTWEEVTGGRLIGPVYAVRDFLLVYIGKWPWPTFNIADSLLVCGAILLVWQQMWQEAEPKEQDKRIQPGKSEGKKVESDN